MKGYKAFNEKMILTKPLEKKSVSHTLGGMCGDKPVITQKGGVGASFRYTQKANTSLQSKLNGGQNGKHKQLN